MHSSSVTAIVLFMVAQAACAERLDSAVAASAPVAAETGNPSVTAANAQVGTRPPGLIKAATAGTRDEALPPRRPAARQAGESEEQPRRGGTAMLLAALALMSGIALRRYGTKGP